MVSSLSSVPQVNIGVDSCIVYFDIREWKGEEVSSHLILSLHL